MKNSIKLGSIFFLLFSLVGVQTYAQDSGLPEEGDVKIGAGLVFGSGIGFFGLDNDLGLKADGYYSVTPEIRAGGDFTFYFPDSQGDVSMTVWELNLNGNYYFMENEGLLLYGLAGINITGFSWKNDNTDNSDSDTEVGLNLGAGSEYGMNFGDLFGEIKLGGLGGNADQFVLAVGVRFGI